MKTLHIESTMNSPEIDFNTDLCEFSIEGLSILTNVQSFYQPVIDWLEEYSKDPPPSLLVRFNLIYYNLASAKRFMFLVYVLSNMKRKGCDLLVEWKFFKDDDFMKEFGEDLSQHFDIPFALVPSNCYKPAVKMAC